MALPMDVCDVDEIRAVIDAVTERSPIEEFSIEEFFDVTRFQQERLEQDFDSVTDASVTSITVSDLPSEHTRDTTIENSEVTSNAPSHDLDQDDMMQEAGGSNRDHPRTGDQQSGLDSTLILIPVLNDEHKERTVVERPGFLPPSGGLVLKPTPVHLRGSRTLVPYPDSQPAAITSWSHGSPPRVGIAQGGSPRPRKVNDPEETAKVRAMGSCQHCSILKVRCDSREELCARCRKWDLDNHNRVCIRIGVDIILRSGRGPILDGGRWTPERSQLASSLNQRSRLGEPFLITVYFLSSDRRGLRIPVGMQADGHLRLHDCSVFETEILKWAESDMGTPFSGNFQRSIEEFLCLYSQRNCVDKKPLVDSVVRMSSLWRLISASSASGLRYELLGQQYKRPLPSSVANDLKYFAQREMSPAEEKAIGEISKIIPIAFSDYNSDIPAVWASLWSVISIYRQALQMAASRVVAFKDNFREFTRRLLDTLIVALCDHYRTRKVLEALDNETQPSFLGNHDVRAAYSQARRERYCFYEEVRASKCHGDDLIEAHIVKNEEKVMGRKRQRGGRQNLAVELVY